MPKNIKYELTLNEIIEKFQLNLKNRALREFYFQGENYKKGCEEMIYIYHSPFL